MSAQPKARVRCPECDENRPPEFFFSLDPDNGVKSRTRTCRVCNATATRTEVNRMRESRRIWRGER